MSHVPAVTSGSTNTGRIGSTRPLVSVIVPCYNEQATIGLLLNAIYTQSYPRQAIEVVIADGLSTDQTRTAIESFQRSHPDLSVRVIENRQRIIPAGLNRALEAARGEYLVRLDAHCVPYPDYIERCVASLEAGRGDNVGGVWEIRPQRADWVSRSIAAAASHPLGVGDARYRYADTAQEVDTVPFGAFHRSLIDRVGPFDETLHTNEDYEFNVRIRLSGGRIWLDPAIRSVYFARPTLSSLARQYWRYGYWKSRMLVRYPRSLRWRQLAPLLVLSLMGLSLAAIWLPFARWLLAIEIGVYLGVLVLAGAQLSRKHREFSLLLGVPPAIATMHLTWGAAFLWGLLQAPFYEPSS